MRAERTQVGCRTGRATSSRSGVPAHREQWSSNEGCWNRQSP